MPLFYVCSDTPELQVDQFWLTGLVLLVPGMALTPNEASTTYACTLDISIDKINRDKATYCYQYPHQ